MYLLDRKLVRDLARLRWQVVAIVLVIACGVGIAVMAFSTQTSLVTEQQRYYRETRFGDVFANATRAPVVVARQLSEVDGVIAVDARAMKTGLMVVPGEVRPATARLIALPDDPRRALNRITVVAGRLPDPGRTDEAVALRTFLDATDVRLGDRVPMVINGHRLSFRIVGAVLSPEYVYAPGASPFPDDAHQGVFWAPRAAVEQQAGLGGAFSAVSLTLAPGVSPDRVVAAVDRALAPYGGVPAVDRADQVSNKFQADRIQRLGVIAVAIPPIFLVVAAALVNMVLGRVVESDREQIGLLKAFGYYDGEVGLVYVKMATLIGLAGAAAGGLLGWWLGSELTALFAQFMRYPHLEPRFSWATFGAAAALSVTSAVAGATRAALRASRLDPALAMQPPPPGHFRRGAIESLAVWRMLDQPTRIIVRGIERFPERSVLTILGLGFSLAFIVGSQSLFGSVDDLLSRAYFIGNRWSDQLAFATAREVHSVTELRGLPGVLRAEPIRTEPARMAANARDERIAVVGLDPGAMLARPLDPAGAPMPLVGSHVVLTPALAEALGVRPGDNVELQITEGRRPRATVTVSGVSGDFSDRAAYLSRASLNRLMADGDLATGANLLVATNQRVSFFRAVAGLPEVVSAASRDETVSSFRTQIAQEMTMEMTVILGLATTIAAAVAYNVARITLTDRSRDLATLRVLGFDERECAYILVGELALFTLVAAVVGVAGGTMLARVLTVAFQRQGFYFPVTLSAHGVGFSLGVYFMAVTTAVFFVVRRVWRFDLVATLKTRE